MVDFFRTDPVQRFPFKQYFINTPILRFKCAHFCYPQSKCKFFYKSNINLENVERKTFNWHHTKIQSSPLTPERFINSEWVII